MSRVTFERSESTSAKLNTLARDAHSNPYHRFHWPAALPGDAHWMDPSLISLAECDGAGELDESQWLALNRLECKNFFSLNVHGIRQLLAELIERIHQPGWEPLSEFFHHFIGEENGHMWYFAEFCNRYSGGLYPDMFRPPGDPGRALVDDCLVFARILIFEEIVDVWNKANAGCPSVDTFVRELNDAHRQDERRHVSFGRAIVRDVSAPLVEELTDRELQDLQTYVASYLNHLYRSFFNPRTYGEVGLNQPLRLRRLALASAACHERFYRQSRRVVDLLMDVGLLADRHFLDEKVN